MKHSHLIEPLLAFMSQDINTPG